MMQKMGSKLNPNAPEFRPSAALALPLVHLPVFVFPSSINPPFSLTPSRTRQPPPLPPSQRPVVRGGYRPTRYSSSHRRLRHPREADHVGSIMRRRMSGDDTHRTSSPLSNPSFRPPPLPVPVSPGGQTTTVMLRNIPNQFTRRRLIQFLDDFCLKANNKKKKNKKRNDEEYDARAGGDEVQESSKASQEEERETSAVAFDFVYLPIDFRTKLNKGYAFVNLTTPEGVRRLKEENLKDQTWGYADSIRKLREIAPAKIQGKEALIAHFEQSRFVCGSADYLPVCFSPPRDGSTSSFSSTNQRNIGSRYHQSTLSST